MALVPAMAGAGAHAGEYIHQEAYEQLKRPDAPPVKVPNPHHQEGISKGLLNQILDQAGISREGWERV